MEWLIFLGDNPPHWTHPWPFWLFVLVAGVIRAIIDLFPDPGSRKRGQPANRPE